MTAPDLLNVALTTLGGGVGGWVGQRWNGARIRAAVAAAAADLRSRVEALERAVYGRPQSQPEGAQNGE